MRQEQTVGGHVRLSAGLEMLPAERPKCPKGHGFMELRPAGTPEQVWCGIWYECRSGCTSAVLLMGDELSRSISNAQVHRKNCHD